MNKKDKLDIKIQLIKKMLDSKNKTIEIMKKEQDKHKEIIDETIKNSRIKK